MKKGEQDLRVIMAGGGTGGHIYPALAIARGIQERWPQAEIIFVGTKEGLENTIIPEAGYKLMTISAQGLDRSSLIKAAGSLLQVPIGFWQARNIIRDYKPSIVIGTGGYVSYPVVLAASIMQVKTVIHEQNAYPGLANRALAKRVDRVLLTFPGAASHFPSGVTHLTGLPIRPEITAATRKEAANFFQLREDKFTLLVVGGSRGSLRINQATTGLLKRYKDKDMQLVWITGSQHFEILSKEFEEEKLPDNIRVFPYLFNMEMGWAIADLAICRAGATTLSELAVRGLPAILIPYPYASEGHQEKNARYLEEKGAALIIVDEFLDEQTLFNNIEGMRRNKFRLLRMAQIMKEEGRLRALDDILDVIQDIKGSDIS